MCFVSLPAYAAGEDETYAQDKSIEEKLWKNRLKRMKWITGKRA